MVKKVILFLKQLEMSILGLLQVIWEGFCFVSINERFENKEIRQIHGKGFV